MKPIYLFASKLKTSPPFLYFESSSIEKHDQKSADSDLDYTSKGLEATKQSANAPDRPKKFSQERGQNNLRGYSIQNLVAGS